jgi:hypothetical protein
LTDVEEGEGENDTRQEEGHADRFSLSYKGETCSYIGVIWEASDSEDDEVDSLRTKRTRMN